MMKRIVILLIVLGALGAGAWYVYANRATTRSAFQTIPLSRGELLATISATGTVEPEEVVDVGAQVAGQILEFGKDTSGKPVDYGSIVTAKSMLAVLDPTTYQADVAQAQAQLNQAKAGVLRAEADLGQLRARALQAERDWERAKSLGPSDALAQVDYDAAQAAYEIAKANVAVGEATLAQDREAIPVAEANLQRAQRNLDYTTILSPVDGVIIDRRVNIGQTVVASLNAPSLFLIAKDLRRMQVWVAVNEADIGSIHSGMPVTFTCDAFPGETFNGEVNKVRLNAQMTQNVVTYTVEIDTDNSDAKLLPYLTANVKFEVSRHPDVLLVPNAALRWTPKQNQIAPNTGSGNQSSGPTTRWRREMSSGSSDESAIGMTRGTIWVQDGEFVRGVSVLIGTSDGIVTEIKGRDLTEGMPIVIGEQEIRAGTSNSASEGGSTNPFMPQMPPRGRGGRRGF